jgi:hypothetical protein
MKQFLEVATALIGLLPQIIGAVKAIEVALPQTGKGAEKLALVKSTLEAAELVASTTMPIVAQLWPAIEAIVGAVVGMFNRTGAFKSSSTPAG